MPNTEQSVIPNSSSAEDTIDVSEHIPTFGTLLDKYRYAGSAATPRSPYMTSSPSSGRPISPASSSSTSKPPLSPKKASRSSPRKRARRDADADSSTKVSPATLEATSTSASTSPTASPRKRQKIREKRGYASPETYEHLRLLQDYLKPNLDVVFCGINPGYKSAEMGHHFGHATNHFWRCLHLGGFTERQLSPTEDSSLPDTYNIGLTNLTERPSKEAAELSLAEQKASIGPFLRKIARHRPRVVCFVGMNIWDLVKDFIQDALPLPELPVDAPKQTETQRRRKLKMEIGARCKNGPGLKPFKLVYESDGAEGQPGVPSQTLFWSLPSTSARVVNFQLADKVALFKEAKEFVGGLHEPETTREIDTFYGLEASSISAS